MLLLLEGETCFYLFVYVTFARLCSCWFVLWMMWRTSTQMWKCTQKGWLIITLAVYLNTCHVVCCKSWDEVVIHMICHAGCWHMQLRPGSLPIWSFVAIASIGCLSVSYTLVAIAPWLAGELPKWKENLRSNLYSAFQPLTLETIVSIEIFWSGAMALLVLMFCFMLEHGFFWYWDWASFLK